MRDLAPCSQLKAVHRLSHIQNGSTVLNHLPSCRIQGGTSRRAIAPDSPIAAQKVGKRGGEDLTNRDLRLSKALRQRQGVRVETHVLPKSERGLAQKPLAKTFRGLVIPQKPRPPESDGS